MPTGIRDELFTPPILVKPIIPYAKKFKRVWCPFDTEESEFVGLLLAAGLEVVYSHIWQGKCFFNYMPEDFDCIISNPPYSKKLQVLKRLYAIGKPFAVLLGLPILNYQIIGEFFQDKHLELLIVDKKVSFNGNVSSFNSSYFCNGFLDNQIVFTHLPHNNTGKNFIISRMGYKYKKDREKMLLRLVGVFKKYKEKRLKNA